ncbi:hypothetical protein [Anaeromyxobacter oryzae]|uniref:Lipoprotein n=1 Tax=Anaeromyxobacter oryzae TaxID=2918170 RepID=A0ABM7WYY4_9BACT|nr:hypothetical protein [Anaeromyxobacter oryzae]BDG04695.1 hypothetical protein AMOR_36910 [Anaeromyxobacter oryzae]
MTSRAWIPLVALASAACAPVPLRKADGSGTVLVSQRLATTVESEHRCPPERITVIRMDDSMDADYFELDVCGSVRRYEKFQGGDTFTWVDVTTLYPPTDDISP